MHLSWNTNNREDKNCIFKGGERNDKETNRKKACFKIEEKH